MKIALDNYCTNLIAGQNICVGPPGGFQDFTTIAGASVTQTALYATTTAARPSPVASGTTPHCGKYYQVQTVSSSLSETRVVFEPLLMVPSRLKKPEN
jgi:hypothetical protein